MDFFVVIQRLPGPRKSLNMDSGFSSESSFQGCSGSDQDQEMASPCDPSEVVVAGSRTCCNGAEDESQSDTDQTCFGVDGASTLLNESYPLSTSGAKRAYKDEEKVSSFPEPKNCICTKESGGEGTDIQRSSACEEKKHELEPHDTQNASAGEKKNGTGKWFELNSDSDDDSVTFEGESGEEAEEDDSAEEGSDGDEESDEEEEKDDEDTDDDDDDDDGDNDDDEEDDNDDDEEEEADYDDDDEFDCPTLGNGACWQDDQELQELGLSPATHFMAPPPLIRSTSACAIAVPTQAAVSVCSGSDRDEIDGNAAEACTARPRRRSRSWSMPTGVGISDMAPVRQPNVHERLRKLKMDRAQRRESGVFLVDDRHKGCFSSCEQSTPEKEVAKGKRRVHFATGAALISVKRLVTWEYASRKARNGGDGCWGPSHIDQMRFRRKIDSLTPILDRILDAGHRAKCYASITGEME